jgi:hypothetical protein
MVPNPFLGLAKSRKFWLLVLDTVFALLMHFLGKYSPSAMEDARFLFLTLQPVFVIVIGAIAYEDKANMQARADLETATMYETGAKIKADAGLLDNREPE